jgi:RNA polymerase sigma-70 factor (ECF subfamily)
MAHPADSSVQPSDREVVARIAAGHREAVQVLVARHGDMMFSLARAILRNDHDAEDVCAEAFVQAWRTAGRFDPERGSVPGWLSIITRSRALDRVRSMRRQRDRDMAESTHDEVGSAFVTEAPDQHAIGSETRTLVARALGDLPAAQRRVIELAYFGGRSQSEIASRLSVPLGTVKSRTLAAMKSMRDTLGPLLHEEVA